MARKNHDEWGECKDCKWFEVGTDASVGNTTLGRCIEEGLQRFALRVSGNSGCNCFVAGEVAHARGSGSAPPGAKSTR
ncbi:hypothetical protein R5W23_005462 [Gemmata sp. JC673]|uniref:Uncharacterized protein n=1 Tax=Gemmata algarum TaxID=2975278 RepID=A0ABU5ESY8_9BACT|nr:hypothetical protein [Gemmata algarum]MDY3558369.1 hypothetical protein [Gemmata algarum]